MYKFIVKESKSLVLFTVNSQTPDVSDLTKVFQDVESLKIMPVAEDDPEAIAKYNIITDLHNGAIVLEVEDNE